jgi:hypothetical protein
MRARNITSNNGEVDDKKCDNIRTQRHPQSTGTSPDVSQKSGYLKVLGTNLHCKKGKTELRKEVSQPKRVILSGG